jgi:hypothetical protein
MYQNVTMHRQLKMGTYEQHTTAVDAVLGGGTAAASL